MMMSLLRSTGTTFFEALKPKVTKCSSASVFYGPGADLKRRGRPNCKQRHTSLAITRPAEDAPLAANGCVRYLTRPTIHQEGLS